MKKRIQRSGFSLVELLVGVSIMLFVMVATVLTIKTLSKGNVSIQLRNYAEQDISTVYEQIRYEAASNWEGMDQPAPGVERTQAPHWPTIKIISIINQVVDRARQVTLTATWVESGQTKQIISKFSVTHTRGKLLGGVVVVKVFDQKQHDAGIEVPVAGVQIVAPGEDHDVVMQTDGNGICTLTGVKINTPSSGVDLQVDASGSGYYFEQNWDDTDYGTADPSYTKTIRSTVIQQSGGMPATSIPNIIYLKPPATIKGRVVDADKAAHNASDISPNSIGVAAANIFLVASPYASDMVLPSARSDRKSITDGRGNFRFDKLIPGKYTLFLMQNKVPVTREYSGLAMANDTDLMSYDRARFISVDSGDIYDSGSMFTLLRGNISGAVKLLKYDRAQSKWLAPDSSLIPNYTKLKLRRHPYQVYNPNYPAGTPPGLVGFNQSYIWGAISKNQPAGPAPSGFDGENQEDETTPVTTGSGAFVTLNLAPFMLDAQFVDHYTYPQINPPNAQSAYDALKDQYAVINVEPLNYQPGLSIPSGTNPTPILAFDDTSGGITTLRNMIIIGQGTDSNGDPVNFDMPIPFVCSGTCDENNYLNQVMSFAAVKVGPLQAGTSEFHLLDASAFANMSGKITTDGTNVFNFDGEAHGSITKCVLYTEWGNNGYGYLKMFTDSTNPKNRNRIDTYNEVSLLPLPPIDSTHLLPYNMSGHLGGTAYNALPPNLGDDKTTVRFHAEQGDTNHAGGDIYAAEVHAKSMLTDGAGNIYFGEVDPSAVPQISYQFRVSGTTRWTQSFGVSDYPQPQIARGFVSPSALPSRESQAWDGVSEDVALSPAQSAVSNITVNSRTATRLNGTLQFASSNSNWFMYPSQMNWKNDDGEFEASFLLYKKCHTGKVYGKLCDAHGVAIPLGPSGSTIQVGLWTPHWASRSVGIEWTPYNATSADASNNCITYRSSSGDYSHITASVDNSGYTIPSDGNPVNYCFNNIEFLPLDRVDHISLRTQGANIVGYYDWDWPGNHGDRTHPAYDGINVRVDIIMQKLPPGTVTGQF